MNQTFAWEMVGNHHQFHPFKFLVVWSSRLVCFASESFLQPRLQDMVLALCSNVGNWDALGALSQGGCLKHMLGGQWNRSFSVGGLWNLSCSRARYRESLVNRMVISEPCIVCLAATTLSAKINSWPRLILWNHLLLVQWSEFRKNDLPNKYKYLPDPFWRSVARWISSSHPHLDCNTMQWPFLHGHFSWTWPCLSKKETEPCLNSKTAHWPL